MIFLENNQKGFAAFFLTAFVMTVVLGISASIFILTYGEQKVSANVIQSNKAYYLAEAGVEDALIRLKSNPTQPGFSFNFNIGDGSVSTTISNLIGGSRTVTSEGSSANRVRTIQTSYQISSKGAAFYYGAQVGDGGLQMDNLSVVKGNVFSNGDVIAGSGSEITGTVQVTGLAGKISGATIQENALVDVCEDSDITGILYANSQTNCTFGSLVALGPPVSPVPLPIPASDITDWKNGAEAGGIFVGDYLISGSQTVSLGPLKIQGNLTVQNNAVLTLTGTLWVTGSVDIKNLAQVLLDTSYGSQSGVIISDDLITLQNDSQSSGSGQAGSYLMYLSTSSLNPAIIVKNNAKLDIIYTNNGWIEIQNNVELREVTGYGVLLKNNVEIEYESGLQNASFSSGPGGSWEPASWREVE